MTHDGPRPPAPEPDESPAPSPWSTTWSDATPGPAPSTPEADAPGAPMETAGDPSWTRTSWPGSAAPHQPAPAIDTTPSPIAPSPPPSRTQPAPLDDLPDLDPPRRPYGGPRFSMSFPSSAFTTLFVTVVSILLVAASLLWPAVTR